MEILTRYDASSHFYSGGASRNPIMELLISTNCLGVYSSLDITATQLSSLPEDIMRDILSRLPVKSLMQLMSVCKHWLSLIKRDPHFIGLHCIHSKSRPNLLYINPLPEKNIRYKSLDCSFDESKTLRQRISCAEIIEGRGGGEEPIISKVRITDDRWFIYNQVLEPVNGLVCFVDQNAHAIKVYNTSTREETPWVNSTLLQEENDKSIESLSDYQIYRFGFDPEKKEHKVFCFWRLVARCRRHRSRDRPDYECWEAFTIGRDTKWQRINAVPNENNQINITDALPPDNSLTRQVYADGTIYWSNKKYYRHLFGDPNPDDPDVIVAFDVGSETYRVIPIPNFILDEPRDVRLPIGMVALGGHVALLYRIEPHTVKLWMLDDRADKKLDNCRVNNSDWSAEIITQLPFDCDNRVGVFGVAGSANKILFECRGCSDDDVSFTCLYSYDRREKNFKEIAMDGASSFTRHSKRSLVTTFTESLFPVSASQLDKN